MVPSGKSYTPCPYRLTDRGTWLPCILHPAPLLAWPPAQALRNVLSQSGTTLSEGALLLYPWWN